MWRYRPAFEARDASGCDLWFRFDFVVEPNLSESDDDAAERDDAPAQTAAEGETPAPAEAAVALVFTMLSMVATAHAAERAHPAARIVEAEDKDNPLSDDHLVEELGKRGVHIARRTVTKYRKALAIPSSAQRRVF